MLIQLSFLELLTVTMILMKKTIFESSKLQRWAMNVNEIGLSTHVWCLSGVSDRQMRTSANSMEDVSMRCEYPDRGGTQDTTRKIEGDP